MLTSNLGTYTVTRFVEPVLVHSAYSGEIYRLQVYTGSDTKHRSATADVNAVRGGFRGGAMGAAAPPPNPSV